MPELPEVETIVRDLRSEIIGEKILQISSTHPNAMRFGVGFSQKDFLNHEILEVKRRGKYMIFVLEKGKVITMHLRMSGRLLLHSQDSEPLPFERHAFTLQKSSLRFCDQRKFGRICFADEQSYEDLSGIFRLGIEPFDSELNFEKFKKIFHKKKGSVKKLLLDQSLIAGIGNIYADEACFYAGINPHSKWENLNDNTLRRIFESARRALEQGIENRGTSISDFADAFGHLGSNQEKIFVYGRKGKPCLTCGEALLGTKLAGRSTVHCNKCQTLIL
jgi:formamidopyrimidine-DNA glycosylase